MRRLRLLGTSSAILEDARRVGFEHHARPVAAPVSTFHDVELVLFLDLGAYAFSAGPKENPGGSMAN